MKTFRMSDLSHKREEVLKAARNGGAKIESRNTNGQVKESFVMKKDGENGNPDDIGAGRDS